MARFDLTDFEWSVIEPLQPNKVRGKPRVDDRRVLNRISGGCAQKERGPIFRPATGRIRPASIALTVGARRACGASFWKRSQRLMMGMSR